MNCASLSSIIIPQKITSISSSLFSGCTSLITVDLGDNTTQIGEYAFKNCINLSEINLPNKLTKIENNAFYNCNSLTSITFPSSLTTLESFAFSNCDNLSSAIFSGHSPNFFEENVFYGFIPEFTIYFYETANGFTIPTWNGYQTKIKTDWSSSMIVSGANQEFFEFGMDSEALDSYDELDLITEDESLYTFHNNYSYSKDIRFFDDDEKWFVVVQAGSETDITLQWSGATIPVEKVLLICEVDIDGKLIGDTKSLLSNGSITVVANDTKYYSIIYGSSTIAEYSLLAGWNLISFPLLPIENAIASVFDDGLGRNGRNLRDGMRGTVNIGSAWNWENGQYVNATKIVPLRGYWVYLDENSSLNVSGISTTETSLTLDRGWNMIGPPFDGLLPSNSHLRGRCWYWVPPNSMYMSTETLEDKKGYWLNSDADGTVLDLTPFR
ncbi:MAG: leucine-rich repeat domain-containing protein [Verrucomicrobiota bacterium]|nr:leucine-rich repeat domain-containing protein [Verrucomicrobiota bacterium]